MEDKPFIDKYLGVPQCFSRSKRSFLFLLQKASSFLSLSISILAGLWPTSGGDLRAIIIVREDGLWNVDKLNIFFDKAIVSSVLQVPINPINKDCLIWRHDPSGILTVSSANHLANSNNTYSGSSNPEALKAWWKSPSPGRYKVSVSAAVRNQTNRHGYGAVVQDFEDKVIVGFYSSAYSGLPSIFAKAEALRRALTWCKTVCFPIHPMILDSQNLVSRIQKQHKDRSTLSGLIMEIVSSFSSFVGASVRFAVRANNILAHNLAQAALGTGKEFV
uniref:RNase H type-1 domain-containing protein n=1 Tax=Cannabis sativa TaxID=3483 RepID=A0A803QBG8_CANSA